MAERLTGRQEHEQAATEGARGPAGAGYATRGTGGLGLAALLQRARAWRARRYDLAINFEPDIRSNLLLAVSGAQWTAGYRSAGGGPLLDQALDYLDKDRAFLTKGGVFTDSYLDAYIELKMQEVTRFRMTTHPLEFDMYYSL